MTARPSRATIAGQRYLDLRRLARATHRPTDELLQLYALEGFLDRLLRSPHASRFVLKGGVLLAVYDARRPTRDIDLATSRIANDLQEVRETVNDVLVVAGDDGLEFDASATSTGPIREEEIYGGVRTTSMEPSRAPAFASTSTSTWETRSGQPLPKWPFPASSVVHRYA